MIRGIIFDLFDTLVDQNHERLAPVEIEGRRFGATLPALHARAQSQFSVELALADFARRMRAVDEVLRVETIDQGIELPTLDRFMALATHLGVVEAMAFSEALTEVHMGALFDACTTPTHHEAILASLAVDHRLALCSNFSHAPTARRVLAETGLDAHLSTVMISDEVGLRKPRSGIFQAVLDVLGLKPSEVLHVGDDLGADVAGAAALGIQTVWLTRRVADPEAALAEHTGPRPDFALDDLLDLPVLVARMGR